jgi:hypothetical protein
MVCRARLLLIKALMKMKRTVSAVAALVSAMVGFTATSLAHSADQVPKVVQGKEGPQNSQQGKRGALQSDEFGTNLPAGLEARKIADLLAPGRDGSLATLIGAKQWPYHPGWYVAIACFAQSKAEHDSDLRYKNNKPSCSKYYDGNGYYDKPVYLGIIEYRPEEGLPKLIASYGKPLDVRTSWKYSFLPGPQGKFDVPDSGESDLLPEDYVRFDFAPYKLNASETAFGLRLAWNDMYAGGGGRFEALSLFKLADGKLINILSEPVSFSLFLAGSWHSDGTRDHESHEGENVLTVLPHQTQNYQDLQVKTVGRKFKRVFTWDRTSNRYRPVGAPSTKSVY